MFFSENAKERWIYRTIFPSEANKASSRLIQFKKMNEPEEAEANWNYENHFDNSETIQLMMSQKKDEDKHYPKGLSFFSFDWNHLNANFVEDIPTDAQSGDKFIVMIENNSNIEQTEAYKRIINQRSKPKKFQSSNGREIKLSAYICYKANSQLIGDNFSVFWDNNPVDHRTVSPRENVSIPCVNESIGNNLAANPQTTPSLYESLNFSLHCFTMEAAAEPKPLCSNFNGNVHQLACVLYRAFGDCDEENSKRIVSIFQFLDENDYTISALTTFHKQNIIGLLQNIFVSDYIDPKEIRIVVKILQWIHDVDKA